MKIVYIVLKGMPLGGGIEKYTEEVGSRLVRRGHEIVAYTMRHYGAQDGRYRGIRIKTVPTIKTKYLEKLVASFMATLYQFLEKDVDIVHFHAFGPAMLSIFPKIAGKKIVLQGHGLEWKRSRWGFTGRSFLRLTEVPSVRFPHIVTVVSKVQKRYLMEKYKRDSVFIPPGVNPPRFEKPDMIKKIGLSGDDYILFAARLVKEKGAHYLIEAYKRSRIGVKLIIAGDAMHEDAYKTGLYRMAEGHKNILFTGFVTGKMLHELFSNCYMFVLPSETEGLPTALFEAMSYGNCCLVSNIPENLEALNDLGYSFQNKDVDDLAEKLRFLANNKKTVESIKGRARDYILDNYLWDNIAIQFENLYSSLINPVPIEQ